MDPKLYAKQLGLQEPPILQPSFFDLTQAESQTKKSTSLFKLPEDDGRIFSNYFANVIVNENDKRTIVPMRYRVRPQGSKTEVPVKYNVFNARIDSLELRDTWKNIFMKNHGLIPFVRFYEWVPGPDHKTKLISFAPKQHEIMWAPCLWDEWSSSDGRIRFKSFAIITDEPPRDVQVMGHDRCPIFLKKELIDRWLKPSSLKMSEAYDVLKNTESNEYSYQWST